MMKRAEILQEYQIIDRIQMRVEVIKEGDILSLVGIAGRGDPIRAISAKKAAELAGRLNSIGETELSNLISAAAKKAQQANEAAAGR
jgi:hypothetical protein